MNAHTKYSEEEIFKMLKSPNRITQDKAFSQLYAVNYKSIMAMIQKNNGSEEDADDVFQDALIVLHRNVRKDDFSLNCKIGTYIYSVARNLWLKKLRRSSKTSPISDSEAEFISVAEDNLEILEKTEEKNLLVSYIHKMGEDCKKILRLFYYEKMRLEEISKEMGLATAEVAKNKKHRCFKKLKTAVLNDSNFER